MGESVGVGRGVGFSVGEGFGVCVGAGEGDGFSVGVAAAVAESAGEGLAGRAVRRAVGDGEVVAVA